MRKLEAINFMDTAQIQAKIAEYIAKHEANDEMEEEEEEEVEKEEESEDSEMLRFTWWEWASILMLVDVRRINASEQAGN